MEAYSMFLAIHPPPTASICLVTRSHPTFRGALISSPSCSTPETLSLRLPGRILCLVPHPTDAVAMMPHAPRHDGVALLLVQHGSVRCHIENFTGCGHGSG